MVLIVLHILSKECLKIYLVNINAQVLMSYPSIPYNESQRFTTGIHRQCLQKYKKLKKKSVYSG